MTRRVLALAVRPASGRDPVPVEEAFAAAGGAFEGDHGQSARRGVTLLAEDDWQAACADAGASLPWWARRANVLVEGAGLLALVGREVRLGGLLLRIEGETRPCALMDAAHAGLQRALEVPGRGGVYGRVLAAGRVRRGDVLALADGEDGEDGGGGGDKTTERPER